MSKQFEFRLIGTGAPDGELDADQLLAVVQSLKDIATRIARNETDAEPVGRPPNRVKRVGSLVIGMAPGSTCIRARRAGAAGSLDFDMTDEQAFDEKFEALVESMARDERPEWVGDALAAGAADLAASLIQAAPRIEFRVEGQVRNTFKTTDIHRETWRLAPTRPAEPVTFIGRLYAVNLHTRHLKVQDDVGNSVALSNVLDAAELGNLLGAYVIATGGPERDVQGRLTQIRDATIRAAPDPLAGATTTDAVPLDEILGAATGPDPNGGIDLTDEEFASFLAAVRG